MPWENLSLGSDCYLDCLVIDFFKYECYISEDELTTTLNDRRVPDAENAIVGLKVRTTHYEKPRTYPVRAVTKYGSDKMTFVMDDGNTKKKISVEQYFREYIGIKLKFPKLNCLHVGNPQRTVYLPIEVCKIEKGQKRKSDFHNLSICSDLSLCSNMSVGSESFSYCLPEEMTNEKWNENNFKIELRHWVVINYDMQSTSKDQVNAFVKQFLSVARCKGAVIEDPAAVFHSPQPNPLLDFEACQERSLSKTKGELQLVVCVITDTIPKLYEAIKLSEEQLTKDKLATQCIQNRNVQNFKDSVITNMLIKIRKKLDKIHDNQFQ